MTFCNPHKVKQDASNSWSVIVWIDYSGFEVVKYLSIRVNALPDQLGESSDNKNSNGCPKLLFFQIETIAVVLSHVNELKYF